MNKEQQDRLWSELSEESKKEILDNWQNIQEAKAINDLSVYGIGWHDVYKELFGIHNLNPKPQIKTWEDFLKEFHKETDWNPKNEFADLTLYGMDDKIKSKIIATAKIAKLIDLGYGGCISEEEWKDEDNVKNCVVREGSELRHCCLTIDYEFIAFHTYDQYKEFMSHKSNRQLVQQYFMM